MVLVRKKPSLLSIQYQGSNLVTALIEAIYATSDLFSIGQYIVYDSNFGEQLVYGSTIYFLIDEKYIFANEGTPV